MVAGIPSNADEPLQSVRFHSPSPLPAPPMEPLIQHEPVHAFTFVVSVCTHSLKAEIATYD
eukprot:878345-Amphidinium_carterae.2